jgi:hypothetical protein
MRHVAAPPIQTPATNIGSLLPMLMGLISEGLLREFESSIRSFLSSFENDSFFLNRLESVK